MCVWSSFMWQMCSYIPTTLSRSDPEHHVSVMAAKLSASFILETFIHSKEKVRLLIERLAFSLNVLVMGRMRKGWSMNS